MQNILAGILITQVLLHYSLSFFIQKFQVWDGMDSDTLLSFHSSALSDDKIIDNGFTERQVINYFLCDATPITQTYGPIKKLPGYLINPAAFIW